MVWSDPDGSSRTERNTLRPRPARSRTYKVGPEPGGPSPSCCMLVLTLSASATGVATAEDETGPQTLYEQSSSWSLPSTRSLRQL